MNKCKGCEWYGKPYWSIINPCDNCPRENTNIEIITRWQDPTIKEKIEEMAILKGKINRVVMDLKLTMAFNPKDENNCILIDVDHLNYIIKYLKGDENNEQ